MFYLVTMTTIANQSPSYNGNLHKVERVPCQEHLETFQQFPASSLIVIKDINIWLPWQTVVYLMIF